MTRGAVTWRSRIVKSGRRNDISVKAKRFSLKWITKGNGEKRWSGAVDVGPGHSGG